MYSNSIFAASKLRHSPLLLELFKMQNLFHKICIFFLNTKGWAEDQFLSYFKIVMFFFGVLRPAVFIRIQLAEFLKLTAFTLGALVL